MSVVSKKSDKESDSGLSHYCGVFACVLSESNSDETANVAQMVFLGMLGLQHRGQESAGMVAAKSGGKLRYNVHKGMGLVTNIFREEVLAKLQGDIGIGHTRYSTAGGSDTVHCQPFVVHSAHGPIALAHNGELVHGTRLRHEVLSRGVGLSTYSDSEVIAQVLCLPPPEGEKNGPNWVGRIKHFMSITELSYALVILIGDRVYGVRDVHGNRPLCIGTLENLEQPPRNYDLPTDKPDGPVDGWILSSESCNLMSVSARYRRDVLPGEIVEITRSGGLKSCGRVTLDNPQRMSFCIFEYVYFARPDTIFEGQMVYNVRVRSGRQLAIESPVEADIVSSVPESGTPAAKGFAAQSGIPFVEVLCRNRYVGRTFIQPSNRLRKLGVAKKFGALVENFVGKRIILIDDSIVRGNTIAPIIKLLKGAGATEVHIRIASPPLIFPCYMGIAIPTKEELIANKLSVEEIRQSCGADSLSYLTVEGLELAVRAGNNFQNGLCHGKNNNIEGKKLSVSIDIDNGLPKGHCTACLTGDYPVPIEI